jgi:hypothetical protein
MMTESKVTLGRRDNPGIAKIRELGKPERADCP